jgi:hypothetical protein
MPTEITITLPALHEDQNRALEMEGRFRALRCGRRWGKTTLAVNILSEGAIRGESWGYFSPEYKFLSETYEECVKILLPLKAPCSKVDGVIRLKTGGRIDFWTLNNPHAGRSRKYHGVIIDEAAFAGPDMMDIWQKAIQPTLLDYQGMAWIMSTPSGEDEENFFYRICTDKTLWFVEFYAPTENNPLMPKEELERLEREIAPEVYAQEYRAIFINWAGIAFFPLEKLLVDGKPVEITWKVDQIFAVIDTALKDTLEHDGTAVGFFARTKYLPTAVTPPLIILDWDVIQIQGAILEEWLPYIDKRLEELSALLQAREGSKGCWIEDKGSGTVLLQQAIRRSIAARPLPMNLTRMGKDDRAFNVSGHVSSGKVKLSRHAFDKTTNYRGQTKNHFTSQVCNFRIGQKTPHQLDALDVFTYGCAIALGNSEGY